ncbi:MAG: LLM class F420-dependent oxidoreductase, partial [Candidatus Hodarchaeota archaeon]
PKLKEIAEAADAQGFKTLWLMDHFYQVGQGFGPKEDPMLEGYTTLSYLAAATQHVKLGLMVTSSFYRHPGLLIKMVTTLDVLSGGRAILGLGTGWFEYECRAFGIPCPSVKERLDRLEEILMIAKHLWSGDSSSFAGKYHTLENPILNPMPLSEPHPPILIGGEGEKRTLKLVAKYADASNMHLGSPLPGFAPWLNQRYHNYKEDLGHKLDVLKHHCNRLGRNYDEIEKTVLATIKLAPDAMKVEEVVNLCKGLGEMGFHQAIFNMPNAHEITPLEIIGEEIIPQVAGV